jgi:hypothetical protein
MIIHLDFYDRLAGIIEWLGTVDLC